VSDTFIATLWVLDWLPEISKTGAVSQNFHGGPSGTYPPIAFSKDGLIEIRPLYYGLLMFSELVANHSQWATSTLVTTANLPTNAVAHATVDVTGRIKILLVAKDLAETARTTTVSVSIAQPRSSADQDPTSAHIVRLSAPSPSAKSGIKLAGQTFDGTVDGKPRGQRTVESVEGKAGGDRKMVAYEVTLPPLSAAMLVVS
jgi:hypothetical protein